jgi:C4-dicarboxylate transporter DctM subunit
MSGGIGIIIPPSITFVVYSVVASVSVLDLFLAGVVPGLLMGVFMVLTGLWCIRNQTGIIVRPKISLKEKLTKTRDAFWGLLSPLIILGGIYTGTFTPTEAAGISVVYSAIVGVFCYRELKWKDLGKICYRAGISSASIMFIIMFANVFGWYVGTSGLATAASHSLLALSSNKTVLILIMLLILLIAGCFLDSTSIAYVVIPIMLPICRSLNINLVHFGIVATFATVVGLVTPPVGVNLFVGARVGKITANENARKSIPFIVMATVCMLIITFIPQLSLGLGRLVGK